MHVVDEGWRVQETSRCDIFNIPRLKTLVSGEREVDSSPKRSHCEAADCMPLKTLFISIYRLSVMMYTCAGLN